MAVTIAGMDFLLSYNISLKQNCFKNGSRLCYSTMLIVSYCTELLDVLHREEPYKYHTD